MVIGLERGVNDPADATVTQSSLPSLKSRLLNLSGTSLPRLSRKRGH